MTLDQWAQRWGISDPCLAELRGLLQAPAMVPTLGATTTGASESRTQAAIRLRASQLGIRLWRNNRGAVTTDSGRHIRYGLANDSQAVNRAVKSSDLIGITPVAITPEHIGRTLGVFTSVEAKSPGWRYNPNDPHSAAQLAWLQTVISLGGLAMFATDPNHLEGLRI